MTVFRAIVMNLNDNVATVVEPVGQWCDGGVNIGGQNMSIQTARAIPLGHKLAIHEISVGDSIIKYGEVIGLATQAITTGQHVHVRNLESCRGRGDKA